MSRKPDGLILKDPNSVKPRGFDWTAWLLELGASVTITTSTYSVTEFPASDGLTSVLTLSNASIVTGSRKTQVKLNAGTLGGRYKVTNHIVASDSTTDDRSFFVRVEEN